MQSFQNNIVLFPHLKETYGPMAQSIIDTGVEVGSFSRDISKYDKAILFCNDASVIKNLRNGHTKIGWWMNDLRPAEMLCSVDVDYIFLCNTEHIESYKKKYGVPVYYMPQCGIDGNYPSEEPIDWDVLFIGNFSTQWHTNRKDYLDAVRDKKLKVITGQYYTRNQKYLYKNTPISLAISPQAEGYTSNRLYNILSSGGFCMTLWFKGIEKLFVNKKHLVWFNSPEELVELVDYYMAHPEERAIIAEEGRKLYYKKHTAKKRLTDMFALMN